MTANSMCATKTVELVLSRNSNEHAGRTFRASKVENMNSKAGLWIDHRRAVIVTISDQGEETRHINSDVERPISTTFDPNPQPPNHSRGTVVDSTQERKVESRLNTFYDAVLTSLEGADSLLIIGPGEAKGEFQKRLLSQRFPAHVVEVETADKMTDPQIAALVRQHFKAGKSTG